MKIYVCYKAWDYEGCSKPLAIFDTKEKAVEWLKQEENKSDDSGFEELEVK